MSYFHDPAGRTPASTMPGVSLRTFWGERILLAMIDLEPNADLPMHTHPHEQVGVVVRGSMTMTVAGETCECKVGTVFVVPGGVLHGVVVGPEGAATIETFAPVREEYKFPN
jgi:quercetin dioxygenase-like cupin family protein